MSRDWNIRCVDCDQTHHFNDASHRDELMSFLCAYAKQIAALPMHPELRLATYYGDIDQEWFRTHAAHRLVPIDEYGGLLTQCTEWVSCSCGSNRRCTLDAGHAGQHTATKERRDRP